MMLGPCGVYHGAASWIVSSNPSIWTNSSPVSRSFSRSSANVAQGRSVLDTDDLLFTNYPHHRLPISIHVFFVFLMRFAFPKRSLSVHTWLSLWLHLWLHEVLCK